MTIIFFFVELILLTKIDSNKKLRTREMRVGLLVIFVQTETRTPFESL